MEKNVFGVSTEANPGGSFPHSFKDIRIFDGLDIRKVVLMEDAIKLMEEAYSSYSKGTSYVPQRYISDLQGLPMDLFFKPVYSEELGRIAVKILTQKHGVTNPAIPTIIGVVLLLDSKSGEVLSLCDGTFLTALRTGASSGIATQYLARKDSETVAIFGCGAQGETQLEAVCNVRPIKRALLYDLNTSTATKLKEQMQDKLDISLSVEKNLGNLRKADVICTATGSAAPLFTLDEISSGVHINAIGSFKPQMQEISPRIIQSSRLFVDSREAVLKEAGDLIKPIKEGVIQSTFVRDEIGDLINDECDGRQSPDEITLFKSVGIAVQDLFVANAVYNRSVN
ncbi:MAG: ornithine cyclodeaminase family protein [Bacteroidetes bacterium]|nr:ornithine cyclodeaminase family protein [Bacteroidota bacterium]